MVYTLCEILTLILTEQPDGTVKAKKLNPAISVQTIREVQQMMKSGLDIRDIVSRLRTQSRTVGNLPNKRRKFTKFKAFVLFIELYPLLFTQKTPTNRLLRTLNALRLDLSCPFFC